MNKYLEKLSKEEVDILKNITEVENISSGAYNIRLNGKLFTRSVSEDVNIKPKEDVDGIDLYIKENAVDAKAYIPVIVSEGNINDKVYNDFYIGDNATVHIYAGCGVYTEAHTHSEHSGIHRFYIGKNSKVKYTENHFGHGSGDNTLNPVTEIYMENGSDFEMNTTQIQGVTSTIRETKAVLKENTKLVVKENIKTHAEQFAKTIFNVTLEGQESSCHVISRAVATDDSAQEFYSTLVGNAKSYAHSECDAILEGNGVALAKPTVIANSADARLIHEATIGKIAGDQLIKLMTLGLSEEEAEAVIINGFLR